MRILIAVTLLLAAPSFADDICTQAQPSCKATRGARPCIEHGELQLPTTKSAGTCICAAADAPAKCAVPRGNCCDRDVYVPVNPEETTAPAPPTVKTNVTLSEKETKGIKACQYFSSGYPYTSGNITFACTPSRFGAGADCKTTNDTLHVSNLMICMDNVFRSTINAPKRTEPFAVAIEFHATPRREKGAFEPVGFIRVDGWPATNLGDEIAKRSSTLDACFSGIAPLIYNRVLAKIVQTMDGKVVEGEAHVDPEANPPLQKCVQDAIMRWKLPAPARAATTENGRVAIGYEWVVIRGAK